MAIPSNQFINQRDYCATILIAKSLLKEGLITHSEYKTINSGFLKKYHPIIESVGDEPVIIQPLKASKA